jgi:membrane protein
MDFKAPLRRFDSFQQRHRTLAAPLGVVKKFGDDEGGSMVSLIAYRAFFSLFPLLLLMTTVLGYLLADNPELREKVVDSTLSQFPVIGEQLRGGSLTGNGVALAVGIVGSLLAGLGVVLETEKSFDRVWDVSD